MKRVFTQCVRRSALPLPDLALFDWTLCAARIYDKRWTLRLSFEIAIERDGALGQTFRILLGQ